MKNRVTVTINDMNFTLVSEETEEYMQRVAAIVDEKMRAVQEGTGLSTLAAAVLTAANLSDEKLKLEKTIEEQKEQMREYFDEISSLKDECADLRHELARYTPEKDVAPAWEERQSRLDLGEDDKD